MKFLIERVDLMTDEPPCAAATPTLAEDYRDHSWEIEIDTLDDLLALMAETGTPLIVYPPGRHEMSHKYDDDPRRMIRIYDDYIE